MGLFQRACETYDNCQELIGVYCEGKDPLAPISHMVTRADFVITLTEKGDFLRARAVNPKEGKVIIPVTEKSVGRSSALAPHPLCDQIGYLAAFDEKASAGREMYLRQLEEWKDSADTHPKLDAVYRYVSSGTLLEDMVRAGLIADSRDADKHRKDMIIWEIMGFPQPDVWKDRSLFDAYTRFYQNHIRSRGDAVCMVTGHHAPAAIQHLKGIYPNCGNAKLISANDNQFFTYRGRFEKPEQALTVSYEASQKAHNALKWLISNQAVVEGGRAFLCWCPQMTVIPEPEDPLITQFFPEESCPATPDFVSYRDALRRAIEGYQSGIRNADLSSTVTVAFDAATTGRLAVTYYSEQRTLDYLKRLERWDAWCAWFSRRVGDSIQAPSVYRICACAFGTEREGNGAARLELDDRVLRQQAERLLFCRTGKGKFPTDIERMIVERASNPQRYSSNYDSVLNTACAVVRMFRYDHFKEEWSMDLEEDNKDRSYLFGRLLAVLEKVERDTYGSDEGREPNAIRLQSVYCSQPMHYAFELEKQMERAYLPHLKPGARIYYKNLIGDILALIHETPEAMWNQPLSDTYLMGYYLQRKQLYTRRTQTQTDAEE